MHRPAPPTTRRPRLARAAVCATALAFAMPAAAAGGAPPPRSMATGRPPVAATAPGSAATPEAASERRLVVGYRPAGGSGEVSTQVQPLTPGASMPRTLAALRREPGVAWAVPDYVAHATAAMTTIPNDPGTGSAPGDWRQLQWNFAGPFGVDAPEAWSNAAASGHPAGQGVVVAVLDTGVAYANRGRYRRSPDFAPFTFVKGYDFIDRTPYANDHNGHGTFVAGTIAEATNNHYGLTGLAYLARIMPVRVLDAAGEGDASVIAEGIRYAVNHGARVVNLSLEFESSVGAADVPELIAALRYAYRRGVIVVAAAGNEDSRAIPYPARGPHVIAVGASTEHGCLASYSNYGRGIALVAPGGGPDATLPGDPDCRPELPTGRDIFQMTLTGSSVRSFGFPSGYEGTSMATPHVAATVALMLAAKTLGAKPTPKQVLVRLKSTARKLGSPRDRAFYGAGLLDAAAATTPLRAQVAK